MAVGAPAPLDFTALGAWLWDAACAIRGPLDAPKFKDYILPLIFLKRLSDVFDDEVAHLAGATGMSVEDALGYVEAEAALEYGENQTKLVRVYLPPDARWSAIVKQSTRLGEYLTDQMLAVAKQNPPLQGVINVVDYNATTAGQRIVDDERLKALVRVLSQKRLGLDDVEPDILGRAYEYLLRKFAEGQGQSAGEFYTPREVGVLMARLLKPEPGMHVYDPACGSGGLLIKCHLQFLEDYGEQQKGRRHLPGHVEPLRYFGQEINPATFAMARMNAFIHDMDTAEIALGDTLRRPAFKEGDTSLRRFDLVTANPMWNQDVPTETYEHDGFDRFRFGIPPASSADWGWVQHMVASLRERGRMAVVLDTGAVSRGSGNTGSNRERDIRRRFVEGDLVSPGDLVEAVILLPENLFMNTTAPGVILVVNRAKRHPGEILLINASRFFVKGRPKNELAPEHIDRIATLYHEWRAEAGVSAIITNAEAARNDFNLSPSRYVGGAGATEVLPLEEAVVLLREAEEERAAADRDLQRVLASLGLGEDR